MQLINFTQITALISNHSDNLAFSILFSLPINSHNFPDTKYFTAYYKNLSNISAYTFFNLLLCFLTQTHTRTSHHYTPNYTDRWVS